MLIKSIPSIHILTMLAAASLVACVNPSSDQDHAQHHAAQSISTTTPSASGASPAQGAMMGGGTAGRQASCGMTGGARAAGPGGTQHMDKEAMCAMYRGMRDAPNEQARQTMMDQNMRGMSPEMRQQHMEMMRQHCQ